MTSSGRRHDFLADEIEIVVNGTAVHLPEGGDARRCSPTSRCPTTRCCARAGYRPVGVVAARRCSTSSPASQTRRATTGWQRWQPNQELTDFTQGVYAAREMALGAGRRRRPSALGAGGMVGVQIDARHRRRARSAARTTSAAT